MLGWLIGLALLLAIQFAVLFGPPYVPTLKKQRQKALDMLALKPGQVLYDLGCGDGSLLKDAAGRGLRAVGYEINPILAAIAWLRTRRYGSRVKIIRGNFWKADLSEADGIFAFLTSHYMRKMDRLVGERAKKPVRLVSYGFEIPGKKPAASKAALFLYIYR